MSSYVDSLLATGEEIVYRTKKHWIAPLFSTVTGTLLTLGGLAALFGQVFSIDGFLNDRAPLGRAGRRCWSAWDCWPTPPSSGGRSSTSSPTRR